jgi:DNA modification methylase
VKAPYYQDDWVTLYCADCVEVLPSLERHDLLLTDPPYGVGLNTGKLRLSDPAAARGVKGLGFRGNNYRIHQEFAWDRCKPSQELINLAISKAKKAIIFGGNFFELPATKCWLIWDKENGANRFADAELAWTNLEKSVRIKRHLWCGAMRREKEFIQHPTQKPFQVISWCIEQAGDVRSVLDPFCGSGTTLVAAKLRNARSTGIEREERYCEIAANRLQQEVLNFTDQALIQRAREATR